MEHDKKENDEVFVTYCWGTDEENKRVYDFVAALRLQGIHASVDRILSERQTATNFKEMMHKALQYPKVIIILSKGYKKRADEFYGGVGEEYRIIINDIDDNPRKYILASFDGRDSDLTPIGFKGREIVDLLSTEGNLALHHKLQDIPQYEFPEVSGRKPELVTQVITRGQPQE